MLKAILFDLDNTLILFDETRFFKLYLIKISHAFSDIMPLELFQKRPQAASKALMIKDGTRSNVDYFMDIFSGDLKDRCGELWDRFVRFYQTEFEQFRPLVTSVPDIHEVFKQLKGEDLKLVIASNPMWPLDIQKKRLVWAGLEEVSFDFITGIENMAYCKPRVEYYQAICDHIDVDPQHCLMVGNDPVNDMIAAKLNMKTYLTTDAEEEGLASLAMSRELRKHMTVEIPTPDFRGPLSGVAGAVRNLMNDHK
jgi:HAD superfamily hydrolase (TIGR01549 family)